jgi:hypothetical protein
MCDNIDVCDVEEIIKRFANAFIDLRDIFEMVSEDYINDNYPENEKAYMLDRLSFFVALNTIFSYNDGIPKADFPYEKPYERYENIGGAVTFRVVVAKSCI